MYIEYKNTKAYSDKLKQKRESYIPKDIEYEERICDHCGNTYMGNKEMKTQKFCSNICNRRNGKINNSHSRRIKKNEGYTESVNKDVLYKRDKGICQLCGKRVNKRLEYPHLMSASIDHIVPLAKGGSHGYDNCQLAHFICNSLKGDREMACDLSRVSDS